MPTVTIPRSADEVDREWISAALDSAHSGTAVRSFSVGEVIHGSLTKMELALDYSTNPAALPASLYLKAAFEDHGIAVSVRSEAIFYEMARPLIEVRAPHCVFAQHDDEHGIVLMEDLNSRGCVMSNATRPWSVGAVQDGLGQLASLHAGWWGDGLVPGIPDLAGSNALGAVLMEAGYWEICADGPTGVHLPPGYRDREAMAPRIQQLWALDSVRPRSFLHGDAHLANTYLDADGRPGFLDWGGVTAGHWAREVCYFMVGALGVADRRNNERDLLAYYLDRLAHFGAEPVPGWDEAWDDYRRHFVHGLLWFLCPIQMQPEEAINANVERFGAAAADHDVTLLF